MSPEASTASLMSVTRPVLAALFLRVRGVSVTQLYNESMNRRVLVVAVLLYFCWAVPLLAQAPPGAEAYRVTIVLYPGDDPAAMARRLAAMYRGTLETPVDSNGSFTIRLSEAGAGLTRRDPMVAEMDALSLALPIPPSAASGNAVVPAAGLVQTDATTSWTLGPYRYDGSGNIRAIGFDFYAYDKLGRLVVSADASPSTPVVHKQTYTFDPYGNLRTINTAGRPIATFDTAASNRLASVSNGSVSAPVGYDASGNFVSYFGAAYEYDALNMMRKSVTGGVTRSYVYTANDERIGTIEQTGSGIRPEWTIRDSAGQVLRRYSKESNGEWKWQEDYIYRGTQMLAAEVPDAAKTRHFHLDHLGTPRLITGNGGAELSRHAYHPFGEEIAPSATAREKKQFTGHERDSESLDYMHARFYAPFIARFLSVDSTWESADLRRPQSWNRYSYVMNNPVNMVDPDGKAAMLVTAGVGALTGAGFQIGINLISGDDWDKDVVKEMAIGAGLGLTGVGVAKVVDKGYDTYRAAKVLQMANRAASALKGSTAAELMPQAMKTLTTTSANGATKAAMFEKMAAQITNLTRGGWTATRMAGTGGEHIFVGRAGEALVINSKGQLFRTTLKDGLKMAKDGKFEVLWDVVRAFK
jgi:RHS repeat-associated protein